MGRNKIKIERIASERTRLATFNKRKAGLLKKAMELSILCDCEVALLIIGTNNRPTAYSSSEFETLWQRYTQSQLELPSSPPLTNEDYALLYEKESGKKPPNKKARISPDPKANTRPNSSPSGSQPERPVFSVATTRPATGPLASQATTTTTIVTPTPLYQEGYNSKRYLPLPSNNYPIPVDAVSTTAPFPQGRNSLPMQQVPAFAPPEGKSPSQSPRSSASPILCYSTDEEKASRSSNGSSTLDESRSIPFLPSIRPENSNSEHAPAQRRSQYSKRVNRKGLSLHIPNINSLPPAYPRLPSCRTSPSPQSPSSSEDTPHIFGSLRGESTSFPSPSSYFLPGTPSLPPLNTSLGTPTPSAFAQWGQSLPPPTADGGSPLPSASLLMPPNLIDGPNTPLSAQFSFPRAAPSSGEKRKLNETKA